MTKKQIKNLVVASYNRNMLDAKKVKRIVNLLSRADLKEYIKGIKAFEDSKKLTIFAPSLSTAKVLKQQLAKLFPNKTIVDREDRTLLAGVKIIDNDDVYDFNLRNNLQNLVLYISQ